MHRPGPRLHDVSLYMPQAWAIGSSWPVAIHSKASKSGDVPQKSSSDCALSHQIQRLVHHLGGDREPFTTLEVYPELCPHVALCLA